MEINFVKTILASLRHLEKIIEQLDGLIFDKAISTNIRLDDCVYNSAERQIDRIFKLMKKKNNLINLKLIVDECWETLDNQYGEILKMRFIECKKPEAIALRLGISARTYFRYLERACVSLGKCMALKGFTGKWFEENYFDQRWLRTIYERICLGSKSAVKE